MFALVATCVGVLNAQQVTFDRILRAEQEPQNWLTYSGTYAASATARSTQITPANVKNLELQWVFQAQSAEPTEKFEATPLVVDGVMYTVSAPNDVVALDAATGRMFWMYSLRPVAAGARLLRPRQPRPGDPRRHAVHGHDRRPSDRARREDRQADLGRGAVPSRKPATRSRVAPLVVKDKVIVGPAGGEYGIRGFIAAFDAKTGKEAWRFNTIPGPGEPGHETWTGDAVEDAAAARSG